MFGLEGSGFIISIAITFLLIGLVVYLFKTQFKGLESKFATIFQLSQTLATSIEQIKCTMKNDERKEIILESSNNLSNNSEFNSDSDTESDTESDADSDAEYHTESQCDINSNMKPVCSKMNNKSICPITAAIKIIDINDNPPNVFNFDNNMMDSLLNVCDNNNSTLLKKDIEEVVDKTVQDNSEEKLSDSSSSDSSSSEDEENKNDSIKLNYNSLKVNELRELVIKNNITTPAEAKGLKKTELIDLLKKNN